MTVVWLRWKIKHGMTWQLVPKNILIFFTKILRILSPWRFLVTGNSCGFQPGIILELAKALSTSQKIIPSIRIKYEGVPFGTFLKKVPFPYFFCNNIIYLGQTGMMIRRTMVIVLSLTTMLMIRMIIIIIIIIMIVII